jgi:N-acetyl-anhydromuramyl-L-alanine amidase AmpD
MTEIPFPAHGTNYQRGRTRPIDKIVIHVAQGYSPWVWFGMDHAPEAPTSAHVSVDPGGLVYRSVPDEDTAWHATVYNDRSLGLELTGFDGDDFPELELDAAAEVVANWARKFDLSVDRDHIIGHNEVPGADPLRDPGVDFDWPDFMRRVRIAHEGTGIDASTLAIIVGIFAVIVAGLAMR